LVKNCGDIKAVVTELWLFEKIAPVKVVFLIQLRRENFVHSATGKARTLSALTKRLVFGNDCTFEARKVKKPEASAAPRLLTEWIAD
jgi:hypothetical protein